LINANESEISETTLTQLKNEFNNKFIAYEKRIEDLTKQLTGLKNINTQENIDKKF
jgi:hypothetical protein